MAFTPNAVCPGGQELRPPDILHSGRSPASVSADIGTSRRRNQTAVRDQRPARCRQRLMAQRFAQVHSPLYIIGRIIRRLRR